MQLFVGFGVSLALLGVGLLLVQQKQQKLRDRTVDGVGVLQLIWLLAQSSSSISHVTRIANPELQVLRKAGIKDTWVGDEGSTKADHAVEHSPSPNVGFKKKSIIVLHCRMFWVSFSATRTSL